MDRMDRSTSSPSGDNSHSLSSSWTSVSGDDPVCIVGMACRLPGEIKSPSGLWDFLVRHKSGQGTVPPDRFNIDGFHQPHSTRAGVMDADGGYFIQEDVREFENSFFGINNVEATYMDPQQRKVLEVVYECMESAGISMEAAAGTNTGVYVGNFTFDHPVKQSRDLDYLHRYSSTGSTPTIMSNRISHVFNLHGPSFTVDTACSSSVYGLHSAVSAIKAGDCDSAIVAGSNLVTGPEMHYMTHKAGVLSSTSTCHTFDESADGYGRADGVNALYLKRFSRAMKDQDKIWAVIRGVSTNSNGRTPGITQPSSDLQEVVIKKAYANADLDPRDTDYVECHGTGTAVGDPIEVDAIGRCFSPGRSGPLRIGSVKTNLGHSEAASGLTSIIKVALAFENGEIPPTLGVHKLNPKLQLSELNTEIVTEAVAWPRRVQRASVNSFGYGGANAHVILESLKSYLGGPVPVDRNPFHDQQDIRHETIVLLISAASDKSLEIRLDQIRGVLAKCDPTTMQRLAYTLTARRSHLSSKSFLLVESKSNETLEVQPIEPVDSAPLTPLPFVFVFTGQGAQYVGMGKELLEQNRAFAATIGRLDNILRSLSTELAPTWTLEQTIVDPAETSQIGHVTRSQPICTAVQIGLVNVLREWGIAPSAVVGHSSGEIAGAYAANILNETQAILAAYFRGMAAAKIEADGAMMAVGMSLEDAQELIKSNEMEGQVCVACVNAPESVTLSGSTEGIDLLLAALQDQKRFARKLQTGGRAYHSHMMKEVSEYYEELLSQIPKGDSETKTPTSSFFSSVGQHGEELVNPGETTDMIKYWRSNLENPVQFRTAVANLLDSGKFHLLEVGPHSALKGPVQQVRTASKLDQHSAPYLPTLVRNQDASHCIKTLAGLLFRQGHVLNWERVNNLTESGLIPLTNLPTYPWDYSGGLLWYESRPEIELRNRKHVRHELLGSRQLAGNDIDWAWRNVLRLSEAPWLRDHKVGTQVVFPATAYLGLIMEGMSQVRPLQQVRRPASFEFRNVSIKSALIIEEEVDGIDGVEIHTVVSPRKLSAANTSADWYDFSISSWLKGQATVHAAGGVRVVESDPLDGSVTIQDTDCFEQSSSMERWYEEISKKGLNFGPHFQSLKSVSADGNRTRSEMVATAQLKPSINPGAEADYIHPIAIDSGLQTAIMANARGDVNAVEGYLPVFISECRVGIIGRGASNCEIKLHARSTRTGLFNRRMDCTVRDDHGTPLIDLKGVRLARLSSEAPKDSTDGSPLKQRNPCLRVQWKPDILRLSPSAEGPLLEYAAAFTEQLAQQDPDLAENDVLATIAALVDLAAHKNPRMNVVELGNGCDCRLKQLLQLLGQDTAFPRCRGWSAGSLTDEGEVGVSDGDSGPFDVVLMPSQALSKHNWQQAADKLLSLVSEHGVIITRQSDAALSSLEAANFTVIDAGKNILLAIRSSKKNSFKGRDVTIVHHQPSSPVEELGLALTGYLRESGASQVSYISLTEIDTAELGDNSVCISTLELDREFLATMTQEDMDRLHRITDGAKDIVWLTGANMLAELNPNMTLSAGLSRSVMMEQPSLRFAILDIGPANQLMPKMQAICEDVLRALASHFDKDDREFVQAGGLLQISRFGPDIGINSVFQRRVGSFEDSVRQTPLSEASPARLAIDRPGVTNTLHFQQLCEPTSPLPEGFVDVEAKAYSLNAKDVYGINGRVETQGATTSVEFSGIIKSVGPGDVNGLQPGDRVVVMAPNYWSTVERVPAWCAHKMLPDEDFATMATIGVTYSTALYALNDRAYLRAGETILIHSGAGSFGLAAISIAQRIGATVYTTVSSPEKRVFLEQELGVPSSNIFNSRDESFVADVKAATSGRGVHVVINSLTGDLMHASWGCVAKFGRFVEIGKRELVDAGKLDMHKFLQNTTFTAFDYADLFHDGDPYYHELLIQKAKEALELYRAGKIKPGPITKFDSGDVGQAYRYFSARERIGKVVVSLENPRSPIPAVPPKHRAFFDPGKAYILVGCLGGLGRSLSRWMMSRGARNFVFLGRSGADRPQAKELVTRLESTGANVSVVRGDVAKAEDVAATVAACEAMGKPVGGVVQGAMGLHEALFSSMTSDMWHTGIQPKWAGSWNLHNALEGHDQELDFFLLMSSISGSMGTATESNYCAANGFLDAFAQWRRCQGKTAVSVGLGMISEVGYLHENPDVQSILLRKGIQPLNEQEFLHVIDFALGGTGETIGHIPQWERGPGAAHILTGLELSGVLDLMDRGFEVNHTSMDDPRAALVTAALQAAQEARAATQGDEVQVDISDISWLKDVPSSVAGQFKSESDAASLEEAALRVISKQFSNLILMPLDKIDTKKPLAQFGVDSMIASEFRSWFWSALKVDIPFLDLTSQTKSLGSLAETTETSISKI